MNAMVPQSTVIPFIPTCNDHLQDGYIVDPRQFDGSICNVIQGGKIPYITTPEMGIAAYREMKENPNLTILTEDQLHLLFSAYEYLTYLSQPVKQISRDYWWHLLEVLPPIKHRTSDMVETFCMSERETGNITLQVIRIRMNGRHYFFTRYIDLANQNSEVAQIDWENIDESLSTSDL